MADANSTELDPMDVALFWSKVSHYYAQRMLDLDRIAV